MIRKIAVAIALFFLMTIFAGCFRVLNWDGPVRREIVVTVFEVGSSEPIPGAQVSVFTPWDRDAVSGKTDQKGRCKLFVRFGAGGSKSIFFDSGGFAISGELRVDAIGFSTLQKPLVELAGKESFSIHKKSVKVKVVMQKENSQQKK